jgi:peptidoglycan hydrolase-like protein with peptidoglycan-binding domain
VKHESAHRRTIHPVPNRALARRLLLPLAALGVGLLLAAAVTAGGQAQAAGTSPAIVSEENYSEAVLALALRGFTNRYEDPSFSPSDVATRAQVAVYLARALRLPDREFAYFSDVQPTDWGFGEIGAVDRAGIMKRTSLLGFSPNAPVSREEAAALLVGALRYAVDKQGLTVDDSLTPYQVDDWLAGFKDRTVITPQYASSVAIAYRIGLFDMPAEGWLLPALSLTHQELVSMLQRVFVQPVASRTAHPLPVDAVSGYPDLRKGSTGPLVLMLQNRLNALHYFCGEADGKYDNQTRDAVLAFEKYERLKRTGTVGSLFWEHFLVAQAPKPVRQGTGDRLECDLTRQVLMMIRDEKVVLVLHVSTGKFGTPTGAWHLRSKNKGWVTCSLGPIYSPCYFMPRNAIHGYPSVPTYPASHGCIRTPIWLQDVLYPYLSVGMPVDVFYNKAS